MARFSNIALVAAAFFVVSSPVRAESTQPATPPSQGPGSGTEPGGMGSSGWTGGSGGSHIGIGQDGKPSSQSYQSPVATGLDLKGPTQTKGPFPE